MAMLFFGEAIKTVPYNMVTADGVKKVRRMNIVGNFNALIEIEKDGQKMLKPTWIDWDQVIFDDVEKETLDES